MRKKNAYLLIVQKKRRTKIFLSLQIE